LNKTRIHGLEDAKSKNQTEFGKKKNWGKDNMPFTKRKLGFIIYERSLFDKWCKYFNTRWSSSVSGIVILGF